MRRTIHTATLLSALIAVLIPAGVSAGPDEPQAVATYDAIEARFGPGKGRGISLVEILADGRARISTAIHGSLPPDARFRLVVSTVPCAQDPGMDDIILAKWMRADVDGGAFRAEVVPWLWLEEAPFPRSIRLMEDEGIFYFFCAGAKAFEHLAPGQSSEVADDFDGDLVSSRFRGHARRGIVVLDRIGVTRGRLTMALSGLVPGGRYRVVGSSEGCDQPVTPSDRLFASPFQADGNGRIFQTIQDVAVVKDETQWVGSLRIRQAGGNEWACERGIISDKALPKL